MKRILFCAILILFTALVFGACATDITEGDWVYRAESGTACIRKYNPPDNPPGILNVPESLGGYPVTEISGYVFSNLRQLPDWKTEEMPGSKVIILPDTIRSIKPLAFDFDETEEIRIENSEYYETIDGVLFERKTHTLAAYPLGKKDASYTIPEGTLAIAAEAFQPTEHLRQVIVAGSVQSIQKDAFKVFHLHLVLPESVSGIEEGAVIWADRFTSASPRYQVINGMLIDTEKKTLLSVPYTSVSDETTVFDIPEGVEKIGDYALYSVSLRDLFLPSTLKSIGTRNDIYEIYSGSLVFPEGLESIGDYFNVGNLKKIVFPASLKSIGKNCFRYYGGLESVIFQEGLVSIGDDSFCNQKNLKSVVLPQTLKRIGETRFSFEKPEVFENCPKLEARVIPDSTAEKYCRSKDIPYRYTLEGLWQVSSREAEEVLSLPGAEQVLIRLNSNTLELSYSLHGSEHRETYRIEWKDGRLCMEDGYMKYYYLDSEQITLELNQAQLHLTRAEGS